jgi:Cu/Zn superoxide dismutase
MSAGGHFNPTGRPHGDLNSPDHHAGQPAGDSGARVACGSINKS